MAGILRRIFGLFRGGSRDIEDCSQSTEPATFIRKARRVERVQPIAPVVSECAPGSGGVQGLQWYAEKLMMDEDGDVAQEFLSEIISQTQAPGCNYFEVKLPTKAAKLKGPLCTLDGNVHQFVESSAGVHRS
ncbi:hypothetical protein KP509_04G039300 [Ceratopteris richardii]|uniref:Uncharacterized protein n=1 Tax=Ceratopteris richardii TaxID=49495 RepID=A0A8T2UUM2_CERRI|nr:hypothetical protein KP509_04G039300 [Ceratopteris richardii]